jgi:hypothetical protein
LITYLETLSSRLKEGEKKITHRFEKMAKTVAQPKMSTTKLNLKVQNVYIKPLLKP